MTRIPRWRPLRFLDVVVLTSIPLLVAVWLIVSSARAYQGRIQFDDYWTQGASVNGYFEAKARMAFNLPSILIRSHGISPESGDPGVINVQVPGEDWDLMWQDPQMGWGHWMEASLLSEGDIWDVEVRPRGDNSIHFTSPKRTLSVKMPRDKFYKGYRMFGLTLKEVLPNSVVNGLAGHFGLMAPFTKPVPVFLNNQYNGMFRFLETIDESFLRPIPRMPGNIFRGDAAERGDFFKGVPRGVFENPYIWDRVANNDRPNGPRTTHLPRFINDVNGSSFEDHVRLMGHVERDEIARLMAYYLIMGDPYHADAVHNQFWYEDPSTGVLHPIPWDVRLLDLSEQRGRLNAFLRSALRDPFLVDMILPEVKAHLDSGIVDLADSMAHAMEDRYSDEFAYDRLRSGLVPRVGEASEIRPILEKNAAFLRGWMADDTVGIAVSRSDGMVVMDLVAQGHAGSDLVAIATSGGSPVLRQDRNRNGRLDGEDPSVPLSCESSGQKLRCLLETPDSLLVGWDAYGPRILPSPVSYRYFVTGASGPVEPELRNRVTGAAPAVVTIPAGTPIPEARSFSPWRFPVLKGQTHRWSGSVVIMDTVRIPETDTLIIEPGTDIQLGPEVYIVSRGLVLAQGTEANPIRFYPQDSVRPWAVFTLLGHGTDNSIVRYTEFTGGGGGFLDGIEYIGMINVHRADNVVFDHVSFIRNVRSDDTFHVLHGDVDLLNSHFIGGNSDAVDYDISTGDLIGNLVENSGGDGIDLMTSSPFVANNHVIGSGDKGISVGEGSPRPILFNNLIERCKRGIEVKDTSMPIILNNTLIGNKVGIYQRRKNWRYGGGAWAFIANTVIDGDRVDLETDVYSRVTLAGGVVMDSVLGPGGSTLPTELPVPEPELGWLYRSLGLSVSDASPGTVESWQRREPVEPLWSGTFHDGFISATDGWTGSGGVQNIMKREGTLVVELETNPGRLELAQEMDLSNAEGAATAVLELATADVLDATVTFLSAEGDVTRALPVSNDPSLFLVATVELPARDYTGIRINATPRPRIEQVAPRFGWIELRPGHLLLRNWMVFPPVTAQPEPAPVAASGK